MTVTHCQLPRSIIQDALDIFNDFTQPLILALEEFPGGEAAFLLRVIIVQALQSLVCVFLELSEFLLSGSELLLLRFNMPFPE